MNLTFKNLYLRKIEKETQTKIPRWVLIDLLQSCFRYIENIGFNRL